MINDIAFEEARKKIIGIDRQRPGIGTLSEKTVHAILKNYYEPDEDRQEIPIENYVADIFHEGNIMEIQTGQFDRMRSKLEKFLSLYPVTIVYPVPREKWLIWIDEESGELSKKRKSPARGSCYQIFPELYKIKMHLKNPNLRIKIAMIDLEEYKILNGWSKDKKRGAGKYDRIPLRLAEEVDISCPEDYMQFVPVEAEEEFTTKDFAKMAHISNSLAQVVLNILYHMGTVTRVGKKGNMYLYSVID